MVLKKLLLWTAVICSIIHGSSCAKSRGSENPPMPPPAPPAQATPNTTTPHHIPPPSLISVTLLPNQCSFGAENTDAVDSERYAEANALYILANDPAECSGFIDSLDLCFFITEVMNSSYSIQILSFRPQYSSNGDIRSYRKLSRASVNIEIDFEFFNAEGGDAICQIVEPEERLGLSEGDMLGFATGQGFNIGHIISDDRGLFLYVPPQRRKRSEQDVSDVEFIRTTQLKQDNKTATPALKIVMNNTETSSQVFPTPTPTKNPKPNPCDSNRSSRDKTISIFVFASIVIALAVMIVALIVVVFVLCCCLCGCCICCGDCCDCKVFKICYSKKCLCCQRKGQGGQKVSGISEQSMQYNEMYQPTDPTKVVIRGFKQSTKLHENPAYGQQTSSHTSPDKRGLDHTYESIVVSRARHVT